jgi:uncharacterized protein
VELTAEELRVLGCLVEKELTTPQQYPLTLNALTLACNQSSNRDPVVSYDEATVEEAVTRAKTRGLARFVHPSHGRSVLRYRHELAEQLGLDQRQLALLSVLMVRGPQTPGELRGRTDRMAGFTDLAEVEAELGALARREEPLVVRLPRAPGQKEDRFVHCLGPAAGEAPPRAASASASRPEDGGDETAEALGHEPSSPTLAEELSRLRSEVETLRRDLDDLRKQLGA